MADGEPRTPVRMYVRPGCPYCFGLRAGLRRAGLPVEEVDIWRNPAGAAVVRRHASGHETVPTVRIGQVVLVNPTARSVLTHASRAGITVHPLPPAAASRAAAALRRWLRGGGGR